MKLHVTTQAALIGESAVHGQQRGARVEPDRQAGTADASGDFSGDDAATATHVEDARSFTLPTRENTFDEASDDLSASGKPPMMTLDLVH